MNRSTMFALSLLTASLAACGGGSDDDADEQVCTALYTPGIVATIEDAVTHRPLASGSTATLTEGSYSEQMKPYGYSSDGTLVSLAGAYERTGRYSLTVVREGYQTWVSNDILVQKNACHVITDELDVALTPNRS